MWGDIADKYSDHQYIYNKEWIDVMNNLKTMDYISRAGDNNKDKYSYIKKSALDYADNK